MQTSHELNQWPVSARTVAGLAAFTVALTGAVIAMQAANSASSAGPARAVQSTLPVQPRKPAPIDFARRQDHESLLMHRDRSTVVLDMDALESLDAAQELAAHWWHVRGDDVHLTCWVFALDSGEALRAASTLAQQDCTRVVVAL